MSGDPYAVALIALGARQLATDATRGADRIRHGVEEAVGEQDHAAVAFALERAAAAIPGLSAEDAVALVAAATGIRAATAYPRSPLEHQIVDAVLESARSRLTPERLATAEERGVAVAIDEAPELLYQLLG